MQSDKPDIPEVRFSGLNRIFITLDHLYPLVEAIVKRVVRNNKNYLSVQMSGKASKESIVLFIHHGTVKSLMTEENFDKSTITESCNFSITD